MFSLNVLVAECEVAQLEYQVYVGYRYITKSVRIYKQYSATSNKQIHNKVVNLGQKYTYIVMNYVAIAVYLWY